MSPHKTNMLMDTPLKNTHYDSLLDSSSKSVDNNSENAQLKYNICDISITPLQLSILISVVTAIIHVALVIDWPIYLADIVQAGGDPFTATVVLNFCNMFAFIVVIVIRWCYTRELPILRPKARYGKAALFGLFGMMHDILVTFSSLPTRTRPQLLGILSAAILPNTIICRYIILRKGVSIKRLLCAAGVLFGLFLSLIPEIFGLDTNDAIKYRSLNNSQYMQDPYNHTGPNQTNTEIADAVVYGWVWPLMFVGSTLPLAVSLIISEEETKSPEVSFLTFVFWTSLFRCLALVPLFWTTLIPNFGLTTDLHEFLVSLGRGIHCSFSADQSCGDCLASGILFILLTPFTTTLLILLTKYSDGAIYTTLLKASTKPISTLFWTVFVDAGVRGLLWRPQFNIDTTMAFVGLLLIIPATCLYAHISNREQTVCKIELKETKST